MEAAVRRLAVERRIAATAQQARDDPLLAQARTATRQAGSYERRLRRQLDGIGWVADDGQALVVGEQRHQRARQVGHIAADAGEVRRRGAGVEDVMRHRALISRQVDANGLGVGVEVAKTLLENAVDDFVVNLSIVMDDQIAKTRHAEKRLQKLP